MDFDFCDTLARFSSLELMQWVIQHDLLKPFHLCKYCNEIMHLRTDASTSDGLKWKFSHSKCTKNKTTISTRTGSWLSTFKVPLRYIIKAIVLWSRNLTFIEISKSVQISAPVYVRLRKYLIEKINYYYTHNPVRLGGPNVIVQVDETKLNHNVKSHRGRGPIQPTWCLCIVDTQTSPAKGFSTMITD